MKTPVHASCLTVPVTSVRSVSTKPKRLDLGGKDFCHFSTALHQSQKEFDLEQAMFGVKSISDVRSVNTLRATF